MIPYLPPHPIVIPAKAGIQTCERLRAKDSCRRCRALSWIPAFAGMTTLINGEA